MFKKILNYLSKKKTAVVVLAQIATMFLPNKTVLYKIGDAVKKIVGILPLEKIKKWLTKKDNSKK